MASRIGRDQFRLDILVQPVQHEIRKDWADHAALRHPAVSGVELPILKISRFEKVADETQEAIIVDPLPQ